jgi:hypothetical protein
MRSVFLDKAAGVFKGKNNRGLGFAHSSDDKGTA